MSGTGCNTRGEQFHRCGRREIEARFDGGDISSDGGGLLLREVDLRTGIIDAFTRCFTDHRDRRYTEHGVRDLVAQRVYGLALGYEDLSDHEDLRHDPLLATLVGKDDPKGAERVRPSDRGKALAGKSTLNRLELGVPGEARCHRYKKIELDADAVDRLFVDLFLKAHAKPPKEIILDLDATDDPLHGRQEGRYFHGYYGCYCYLPLYIFCGSHLLCARLRPSNIDASKGSVEELERIVSRIRTAWPRTRIIVRGDSGFCRDEILTWCEQQQVDYVVGMAKNPRLMRKIGAELVEAKRLHEMTGEPARLFAEFGYRTRSSWSRRRRVIAKAEHLPKGSNPRFVVTSLDHEPSMVYERLYAARGDMENRIKEQQLYLFADRTSSHEMRANQLRLYFSSVAYTLMDALRRIGLAGTEMARSDCRTIREKLLKLGAQVRVTVRRIWISLSESFPRRRLFLAVLRALRAPPRPSS